MSRVVLSLGSNQGERRDLLRQAIALLDATDGLQIDAVSPVYETAAWGKTDQPDFLNLVALGRTDLAPEEVLDATQAVEQRLGRVRHEHWGPRTIDVDIVDIDGIALRTERLTLPHPYAHERAFVMVPWADVDPMQAPLLADLDTSSVRPAGEL